MNLSLTEIRSRRGELVERARAERVAVRGVAIIRLLVARKGLLLVAALAFAVVHPRRALRWVVRGWGLFRIVRKISRAFA
jgi:hypothetical protein